MDNERAIEFIHRELGILPYVDITEAELSAPVRVQVIAELMENYRAELRPPAGDREAAEELARKFWELAQELLGTRPDISHNAVIESIAIDIAAALSAARGDEEDKLILVTEELYAERERIKALKDAEQQAKARELALHKAGCDGYEFMEQKVKALEDAAIDLIQATTCYMKTDKKLEDARYRLSKIVTSGAAQLEVKALVTCPICNGNCRIESDDLPAGGMPCDYCNGAGNVLKSKVEADELR